MPVPVLLVRGWPLLALAAMLSFVPEAHAQRVSARDRVKIEALDQRMAAAEKRYRDALVLVANADPKGKNEGDAALEDMEDVISACVAQKGCQVSNMLPAYKRLLKDNADNRDGEGDELASDGGLLEADPDHIGPLSADVPEAARAAALLNDKRHAFDNMVEYNPAVQAGIRRWLTDMRPALMTTYENYQNLRQVMWPEWEKRGLPEALLFGIMAKESNGRVHASSRAGAAGLMQFMPATGRRFGLGPDGTGFDTRFDARSAAEASATYLNERMRELNGSVELSLAGYNGGEGRAVRVFRQSGGQGFWVDSVYNQFPGETKDYVPMVIAAAWIFLHPQQYGVEFPKISAQPATIRLAKSTTIYELTICLGSAGTRDGYMRALRNLNPRYEADGWIPAGTTINATTRIAGLYNRYCVSGPRADLARTLITADLNAAIVRPAAASYTGNVAVGSVVPVAQVQASAVASTPVAPVATPAAKPKAKPARSHKVGKGQTLGAIADKFQCDVRELARANGLKAPAYALRQGQVLKLQGCGK
ncbi:MAG: transglycosylase SLT domain-containing protein [Stenotrophomonas rhizophila]|uniref:transglycosylase SLT domain-containing protein n=1 Tax=Stenotrophomonas rhizophila TaxID=216778 RepID=UPI0010C0CDE7|nr:transglycosylase SLT domain-containing protein [Stenotrophomonas rhizophila]MDY0954274.1 transglycosylase SLT domain-containing protein [Stenotrophomonas rhizophila]TKK03044.1 lytic transglycosylase [Stenotrophomonas rhizophila]